MKALVTGGGGFLGRRIVELLLERGDSVRSVSRHTYDELEAMGVDCLRGDLCEPEVAIDSCRGVDVVFHVAAKAGVWGDRSDFYGINVKGTANVIRGCLESNVRSLVYTSSPSVVIEAGNIENGDESLDYASTFLADYPASKAEAEKLVLDANGWEMVPNERAAISTSDEDGQKLVHNLRTCALRPHLIWGPRDPHLLPRVVAAAAKKRLAIVGNGRNLVDLTYVDNAAHAHLLAADELNGRARCAGKAYFVGDAEPVLLWPWINEVLKRLGMEHVHTKLPYWLAYGAGAALEFVYRSCRLKGEPPMTRFVASQFAHSHYFRHDRARRDFGYQPIVTPAEGMDRLLTWMQRTKPWETCE